VKALVIGYGSIGKRHAANLAKLGHEVSLLRHARGETADGPFREFYNFEEALAEAKPDCAVVASPTPCHAADAAKLIDRGVPMLLEKPPALDLAATLELQERMTRRDFKKYDLAFNMRCYPPLRFIKDYLPLLGKIYAMRVAAGSYLPGWRPTVDYRKTTSARAELGGGVHIELVHEVDYVLWFLGMPEKVVAHVTRVGNLEINSADICAAMLMYADGSVVELHLDYLSHKNLRGCQIIAERGTLDWSFTERNVSVHGAKPERVFELPPDYDFNETYLDQLRNFEGVVQGTVPPLVNISHGVQVMKILDAMVRSSATARWVDVSETTTKKGA
jgi:predicted dehydrogenase